MFQFRPHHFLCTLGFQGKGYSPVFVSNFQKIADHLRANPDSSAAGQTLIEVVAATDGICEPCPNRNGNLCAAEEKIQKLDQAHARVLGLRAGQILTWAEAKSRIAQKMTDGSFEESCAPCSWKSLGFCKAALLKNREMGEK